MKTTHVDDNIINHINQTHKQYRMERDENARYRLNIVQTIFAVVNVRRISSTKNWTNTVKNRIKDKNIKKQFHAEQPHTS